MAVTPQTSIWLRLGLAFVLVWITQASNAVTLGQIDDFEDGTVLFWFEGGSSPNQPANVAGGPPGSTRYLQDISSGGPSSGGKMTMFNEVRWTGDFLAEGIGQIRAMVRVDPTSASALSLRIGFRAATEFGQQGHASVDPVVVPNDGAWHEVVFPIGLEDLAPFNTEETYESTLSNVGHMRIFHSTVATFQGLEPIAATMGIDNITAEAASSSQDYTGWLWDASVYSNGFSVQEENCFGQLNLVLNEDDTWTASGTDEICRGRDTQQSSRSYINPAPSMVEQFEAQSTRPLHSAGGNLYELYGEDVVAGVGQGEGRLATLLAEPSDGRLLFVSGHDSINEPGNLESSGFLHVLVKTTPSIVASRTAAGLEGTSWRIAIGQHNVNAATINGEFATSTIMSLDLEAGGVCSYSPSSVIPDFVKNRDVYVASQFSTAANLDNRGVQAGVSVGEFSDCSYTIDGEGYLAIDVTLTLDANPTMPAPVTLRYAVSDDEQYLVPAPAAAGPDSSFSGLVAGFRAANTLPTDAIDGNYLFYLMLSEFSATGTFHSGNEFGRQEFDFRGRGLFSFDSTTPGTVPAGETGTWFGCSASMVQNGFELGYTGDYSMGTATVDAEVSAEELTFDGCDYRIAADGGLSVHVVATVPGEPDPFEATLNGYVNSNGELFALSLATSEPPLSAGTEDFASVFLVLGMEYTGDPTANEDDDELLNVEEFQAPLPPDTFVSMLLRRSDLGRWLGYEVDGTVATSEVSADLTDNLVWEVAAVEDFNGDDRDDVLLRRTDNGRWYLYLMNGSSVIDSFGVNFAKSFDWQIAAIGDFNGDGNADIVLRNQVNGRWNMHLMDGYNILENKVVNIARDFIWDAPASGDFDGDGFDDILTRRSDSGVWRMYRFNGTTIVETALVDLAKDAVWQFERTADFNGDGKLDILIRRTDTGRWRIYAMDGTQVLATDLVDLATGTDWQLGSAADFDLDGRSDALISNPVTGQWRLYLLDGTTILSTGVLAIPSATTYELQAVADFNTDANKDLMLRNMADGRWYVYLLNGTTVIDSGNVGIKNNLVWELVVPELH